MAEVTKETTPLLKKIQPRNECEEKIEPKTCGSKLAHFLSAIRLEPTLLMFGIIQGLETVFETNIIIDKVCNASYSLTECQNLDSGLYPQEQDAVQRITNEYNVYLRLIEYIPGIIMMLLLGSWSDHRDRKWPILLPLIGNLFKGLILTANSYWWFLPPQYLLLAYVPIGLTGSDFGLFTASYAYIGAASSSKTRSSRVALLVAIRHLASPAGQALAELLFDSYGYVAVFGLHSLVSALAVVYSFIRLEKWPGERRKCLSQGSIWQVISPKAIKKTFSVVFKKREDRIRGYILGFSAIVICYVISFETKVFDFLYCRKRFGWDHSTFTIFSIIDRPMRVTGCLIILPLLSYYYSVDDAILAFTGGVSTLFLFITRGTAPQPWVMYLSSTIGFCNEMVMVSSRAAISKLVEPEELGAIFAFLAISEAIIPIVTPSVFTIIYNDTIDFFPGTIYLVAAFFTCIILVIITWISTRGTNNGPYREIKQ